MTAAAACNSFLVILLVYLTRGGSIERRSFLLLLGNLSVGFQDGNGLLENDILAKLGIVIFTVGISDLLGSDTLHVGHLFVSCQQFFISDGKAFQTGNLI